MCSSLFSPFTHICCFAHFLNVITLCLPPFFQAGECWVTTTVSWLRCPNLAKSRFPPLGPRGRGLAFQQLVEPGGAPMSASGSARWTTHRWLPGETSLSPPSHLSLRSRADVWIGYRFLKTSVSCRCIWIVLTTKPAPRTPALSGIRSRPPEQGLARVPRTSTASVLVCPHPAVRKRTWKRSTRLRSHSSRPRQQSGPGPSLSPARLHPVSLRGLKILAEFIAAFF